MLLTIASVTCLATNIYFEARSEDRVGQYAVAEVTLNRVASPDYPDDVCEVVWQDKQFSWTHDGKSDKPTDAEAWSQALSIAANAIDDYEIEDMRIFRQTVLYYHAKSVTPYWSKEMRQVGVIGSHIFYEAG
jgi:spore germination cell wall hydrolase CwlJ-like protein